MTSDNKQLDCVVIGYNETPFDDYESLLKNYGEDSEAYRDLRFSFINYADRRLNYVGLMNYAYESAQPEHKALGARVEFESGDIPNLAAVYLTNYLCHRGIHARYVNLFQHEKEKLISYLNENPYCVAITTTFYVLNFPVIEMVEFIRKHNKDVKIVVGGPLIANHTRNYKDADLKSALDDIGADLYVTDGQGELTLTNIVQCLRDGRDLDSVPNITFFREGVLHHTMKKPENNSMDENYIDWKGFPEEALGPTLQTRTARSCAFKCSFCNYPARAGALSLAKLDTLEKEFNSIRALGDVQNLVFIDDTFNVPLPRFKDICRLIIEKEYSFNWFSYFRCSNSDEEAIELMAKSGCKGVFLGIESGSPSILKNMNKAATIEKYATGLKLLHEYGILSFGSFITGFPGETEETVNETVTFIKETKPNYWRTQMWYCEPGTPIDHQRTDYGITGEGFIWRHNTMDSLEAMDHIDRMFLLINESIWLPQWSFDFWIIPYLLGKGITEEQFREFMSRAHKLLALEIASVPENHKNNMQKKLFQGILEHAKSWKLIPHSPQILAA